MSQAIIDFLAFILGLIFLIVMLPWVILAMAVATLADFLKRRSK